MNSLEIAVSYVLDDEGPEINEGPDEPGGISKFGVSLAALQDDYARRGLPKPTTDAVRGMTRVDAASFYARKAISMRFEEFPVAVDYVLFNTSISVGPSGAALIAQMALQLWPTTAQFDDKMIQASHAADPKVLIHSICTGWLAWKARSGPDSWQTIGPASWEKYGHGWHNRDMRVRARALLMLENRHG